MEEKPIRLVIVDDSAFVRRAVREMLAPHPEIIVAGQARNGQDALRVVAELRPDVVTCDLNMPEMNGVEFVRAQMARRPTPILVLTSSPKDGEAALESLQAGAVDFLQKPTALANEELATIREELVEKIKAAASAPSPHAALDQPKEPPVSGAVLRSELKASKVDIVVLGISTGGPQALRYLMPQFPVGFPVPIVIVLHMPIGYTAMFAEKLAELSALPVKEAWEGCPVQAGQALLAPAGRHLTFCRGADGVAKVQLASKLSVGKPHCPSVDVMFGSAAEVFGKRVLAVVMTGMGDDGKEGATRIKAKGGTVITEAEESCVVYGMPRSVAEAGLSDATATLSSMAEEISKRI